MSASAREIVGAKYSKKSETGSYGLSAELRRKQDAKYDYDLEDLLREWIEDVRGKPLNPDKSFHECLKSGICLCRLLNKLKPGTVKKISKSKMPFNQMGNISMFLTACRKKFGIPEHSCFSTVDLYEAKNMGAVLTTLDALRKGGGGRKMKVKTAKERMGNLTGFDASINKVSGTKRFDAVTGGADASAGLLEAERGSDGAVAMAGSTPSLSGRVRRASRSSADRRSADLSNKGGKTYVKKSAGYDGSFGLSAEVRAKMDAKYDYDLEMVIQEWIEDTLNEEFQESFADSLRSGVVLCKLMNELPGKQKRIPAKKISKSKQKFSEMGNINLFLKAAREFGLSEHSCFSTVDLHEQKNMMAVLTTLDSIRRGGTGGRKEPIKKRQMASQYDPSIRTQKGTANLDQINRNVTYRN